MKLILATWNTTKLKWLSEGFSKTNLPIALIDKEKIGDVDETGITCEENSLIKVRAVGPISNSIIIGEDSALFIEVLNGFPGTKTVRWMPGSDDDRSMKILEKMEGIPKEKRNANFVSAVALLFPNGEEKVFLGVMDGSISLRLIGKPGKGYQRIFLLKNRNSIAESGSSMVQDNDHRHQAICKAIRYINDWLNLDAKH